MRLEILPPHSPKSWCAIAWCNVIGASCLFGDITARGWVEFSSNNIPLQMIDLRESGCLILGAPTDAAHARNQAAGLALGHALYEQHADIDGIWYQSRLTGGDCLAIFDRALENLTPTNTGDLESHPRLPEVLRMHRVRIER
jgi:hypothetical protein